MIPTINFKKIFRSIVCLILICCLVVNISPIKAKATLVATLSGAAGISVGLSPLLAVAGILVAVGVGVGLSKTDFWDVVEDTVDTVKDSICTTYKTASGAVNDFVNAWKYEDRYYFPQTTIQAVNESLYKGNVSYDSKTDTLVSTAPVSTYFESSKIPVVNFASISSDTALAYLYNHDYDLYELAASYGYCTEFYLKNEVLQYCFSAEAPVRIGGDVYYDGNAVLVSYLYDGRTDILDGVSQIIDHDDFVIKELTLAYKTNRDLTLNKVSKNSEKIIDTYVGVTFEAGSPGDDGSGNNDQILATYAALTVLEAKEEIEKLTQEEALSGENSSPDIVVNLDSGEIIETNGKTAMLSYGQSVGVNAETAVASIMIALGYMPGRSNTLFRELVTGIVNSLPSEYLYSYGSDSLLQAWLYNDVFYFNEDILTYVNDCLVNGTSTTDPIYGYNGGFKDSLISVLRTYYDTCLSSVQSKYPSAYAFIQDVDSCNYISCGYVNSSHYIYLWSENPIDSSGSDWKIHGKFVLVDYNASNSSHYITYNITSDTQSAIVSSIQNAMISQRDQPRSFGLLDVDLTFGNCSTDINDLGYDYWIVSDGKTDLKYYPVKLFPNLDEAETATQTEIQTDYKTSVPGVIVDVSSGSVIEFPSGSGSIGKPDPVPDPDPNPNPNPDPNPDPGSDTEAPAGFFAGVLNWLESIWNKLVDILNSIKSLATGITTPIVNAVSNVGTKVSSLVEFFTGTTYVESPFVAINFGSMFDLFPFNIPYGIYQAITFWSSEAVAPTITIPLPTISGNDVDIYEFEINFSEIPGMDILAALIRSGELILFVVGLVMITRKVTKW